MHDIACYLYKLGYCYY